ncbi:MAG: hypothetical protein JWQ27_1544 [Ferruginibacter sp.]|nr:hypothetical protein [Ferruginibacter sp.]
MVKQYISIVRLFEHAHIDHQTELNSGRLKKQVNAVFAFEASGILSIDGFDYNKNDVLEEIDRPDFAARLPFHQAIWNNKALLGFLEDHVFYFDDFRSQLQPFNNHPEFEAFFSPYFAGPFNTISRNLLQKKRFNMLSDLMLFEEFVQPAEREEGFRAIRIFLEESIRLLKNTSVVSFKSNWPELQHWAGGGWAEFLNYLPDEFEHTKNSLVIQLVNLTVRMQQANINFTKTVSRELTNLRDLSDDMMVLISGNDKIYRGSAKSGGNWGWIIWAAIILLRILSGC